MKSLEEILIEQEEQARLEEEEEPFLELKEVLANRKAGTGRGNSFLFTVYSVTDIEGNALEIEIKPEKVEILTKKQAKERRKWERKKERKHLTALINSIQDF